MLTVEEVAEHYAIKADTVRRRIKSGDLSAVRICRNYRLGWRDVWACEQGSTPKRAVEPRYQTPLMSKKLLAAKLKVSVRTVERWQADGLPTRNVFGAVRFNRHDVEDWLKAAKGVELWPDWWT